MALHLTTELLKHQQLQEALKSEFPEADDETLEDTLEGLTELTDMIAAVLRSHLQDLALIRGLKGRIAEMQARVGRFERRAEKKRQLATSIMEQAAIRKLSGRFYSVTASGLAIPAHRRRRAHSHGVLEAPTRQAQSPEAARHAQGGP